MTVPDLSLPSFFFSRQMILKHKNQSIARLFMLTFYNFCGCVGTRTDFIKKKRLNVCLLGKIAVPLPTLS